ncbi:hypothetical protein ABPG74_001395 [Tetrahymena malaccensis]
MWTDQQCNLLNKGMNQYTCFCKEQLPTTLIEDINSIKLINNSLQSPIEQQTIFDYVAFWMIQLLTITFFILFALGKYLDFKSISQTCKQNENLKVASLSGLQLKQNERTQKQTLKLKNINQQQNSEHKPQDKSIFVEQNLKNDKSTSQKFQKRKKFVKLVNYQVNINQLESLQDNSSIKLTQSQLEKQRIQHIKQIKLKQSVQNLQKKLKQIQFLNKLIIFHSTFGIYYIHNKIISRSTRYFLLYLRFLQAMALSIQSKISLLSIENIQIGFLNVCLIEAISFILLVVFRQGKIGKILSITFQIILTFFCYYIIIACTLEKTQEESNQFMNLFTITISIDILFIQFLCSLLKLKIIEKYFQVSKLVNQKLAKFITEVYQDADCINM